MSTAAQHVTTEAQGHAHQTLSSNELIQTAREAFTKAGEQWTSMREAVFVELVRLGRPASAYVIADRLSIVRGKRVAPNSIYCILDLFVLNKLAIRIESSNAFVVSTHPGCEHDCIFLVCDECGDTCHVDDDMVSRAVRKLAANNSFKAERPVLEIRGLCQDCA